MKLNLKKEKADNKQASIQLTNLDRHIFHVGSHVSRAAVKHKTIGLAIPRLSQKAYLVVKGPRGTILQEVHWDGKDIYMRKDPNTGISLYGSLSALKEVSKPESFETSIFDMEGLMKKLKSTNKSAEYARRDGSIVKVALLNSSSEQRCVSGIALDSKGKMSPFYAETKQASGVSVAYRKVKDIPAAPVIREIAKV